MISIGYVKSSKPQVCHYCGEKIPARAESVKTHIERVVGGVHSTRTFYSCMKCEKEAGKSESVH